MNEKISRSAKLDLLRIFSMFLIVLLHSIDHSGVLEATSVSSLYIKIIIYSLYGICQISVNCYVILSGYFLVKSKFKLDKLIQLWLETVFYGFIFKIIIPILDGGDISILSLASCLVPIFTGRYWFITIYFGLYLVFPFLNRLALNLSKKEFSILNLILFCLFSLMISVYPSFKGMNSGGGWGLAWFVVLYLLGAWFRLYCTKHIPIITCLLIMVVLPVMLACAINFIPDGSIGYKFLSNQFRYDSVFSYLLSVVTFDLFLGLNINNRSLRSLAVFVGPLTFAVYLIHAHADVSPFIWDLVKLPSKMVLPIFPLIQFGVVLLIFLACLLIELIRQIIFVKSGIEKNVCRWLTRTISNIFRKVLKKDYFRGYYG